MGRKQNANRPDLLLVKLQAIFLLTLLPLVFAGCSKPITSVDAPPKPARPAPQIEYPILVVDEEHQMRGSNLPPAYQISPASGIRLDATQFLFKYGSNALAPNAVQLISTNSLHRLSRETETNFYTIDYYKLETVRGDSFRGFNSGDHVTLVIGRATNTFDAQELWVMWMAQLEVK
jgi:hypothetical protein